MTFEELLSAPMESAERISKAFELSLDTEAMAKCVVKRSSACYEGLLEAELLERYEAAANYAKQQNQGVQR